MPSPFPGMDPYIEPQAWPDFHLRLISTISDMLVPSVRPRYLVRAEERIYLEHEMEGQSRHIRPDLVVVRTGAASAAGTKTAPTVVAEQPVEITLPIPEEVVDRYLMIVDSVTRDVVTIIEVLSPANKRAGSDGRAQYLMKRESVLLSRTNLVEIDLLRDGLRLPAEQPLPPADYYALVCRGRRRPIATAYHWTVRQSLPSIPIPLAEGESEINLDLQVAFTTAYDRAGYDYSLDYSRSLEPPLADSERAWALEILHTTV